MSDAVARRLVAAVVLAVVGVYLVVPLVVVEVSVPVGSDWTALTATYTGTDLVLGRPVDLEPAGPSGVDRTLHAPRAARPYAGAALGLLIAGAVLALARRPRGIAAAGLATAALTAPALVLLVLAQERAWAASYAELTSWKSKHADWMQPGFLLLLWPLAALALGGLAVAVTRRRAAPVTR